MTDRWEEIERIGAEPQPSDRAFGAFAAAAATACLFELKARLFADNTPFLRGVALINWLLARVSEGKE